MKKTVHLKYFAQLQEKSNCSEETIQSEARTPAELYQKLQERHGFNFSRENLRVVINDRFADWDDELFDEDQVVFLPPFAGG